MIKDSVISEKNSVVISGGQLFRTDGTWVIRTPTYTNGTGSNGLVYYTRVAGDRTVSGLYRYQLYLYASANALFRTVEYTEWVDPILMAAT